MNSGLGLFDLPLGPVVMGIVNIAPDTSADQAISLGENILRHGAAMIDIGSDAKLSVQQELDLVIPVVAALVKRIAIPVSVYTSNPEVMQAVVAVGARMINDKLALTKPGAAAMIAKLRVPVCLMHMQDAPNYNDIVKDVYTYLEQRIARCKEEGIEQKNIIIDPGFGFGKNLPHNLNLLKSLRVFKNLNSLLLVGLSNKSMIGQILDTPVDQRTYGSLTAEILAIFKGADIIRTHEVKATVDAIKIVKASMSV